MTSKAQALLALLLLLPLSVSAQKEKKQPAVPAAAPQASTINADIVKQQSELLTIKQTQIDTLQKQVNDLRQQLKTYQDSCHTYRSRWEEQQNKNLQLQTDNKALLSYKQRIAFSDTIMARLSNDALRFAYSPERVQRALQDFEQIGSPELKEKFQKITELLKEYEQYDKELRSLILGMDAAKKKALISPIAGPTAEFRKQLHATAYYQRAYNKSWTIPYLNKVLDHVFKTLRYIDENRKMPSTGAELKKRVHQLWPQE